MLRGIIKITKAEAREAQVCVKKYLPNTQLKNKLEAALNQNTEKIEIQLGDLEVEQLLDNMAAPSTKDSDEKKKLRKSLQEFMTELKGMN